MFADDRDVVEIVERAAAGAGGVGAVGHATGIIQDGGHESAGREGGPRVQRVEDEVLVFDIDEPGGRERPRVAQRDLGRGGRGGDGGGDRGAAGAPPTRDAIDDGIVATEGAADFAALGVEADFSLLERPVGERERAGAARGGEVIAPTALVVVEGVEAGGEFSRHEREVEIEGGPALVLGARLERRLGEAGTELGALGGVVDDAAGRADAEEHGVGAARIVEALRAVEIGAEARLEVVAGAVAEDAARAEVEGVAGGGLRDAVVDAQGVAVVGLTVVGVGHGLLEIGRADIEEEFLGEHVDDRGRVFERGVEAAAGEGTGGDVADVASRVHLEGGKHDRVVLGARGVG